MIEQAMEAYLLRVANNRVENLVTAFNKTKTKEWTLLSRDQQGAINEWLFFLEKTLGGYWKYEDGILKKWEPKDD